MSDKPFNMTDGRKMILASASFHPPAAYVVSATGGRTGHERNSWRRSCEALAAAGFLEPSAHDDWYLTAAGQEVAESYLAGKFGGGAKLGGRHG